MVDLILQSNALVKEFPTGGLSIGRNKDRPSKKRILDGNN